MTPPPVDVEATLTASWIFMAVGALFFVFSLAWAVRESGRTSAALPLLALLGGVIASLEEPWINVSIQLWYPENSPLVVYTAMGHHQPLYLHLVYPGFVGLGAYVVHRGLLSNPDGRLLWRTFLGIAVLDLVFEGPATAAGIYAYYGAQPFQLFSDGWPAWVAFVNAAGPVLGGWLIFRLAPRLVGRQRLLLTLIPPAAYAACTAPPDGPRTRCSRATSRRPRSGLRQP